MFKKIGAVVLAVILILLSASPIAAAETPTENLDAAIVSANDFTVGDEGVIQFAIQNNSRVDTFSKSSLESGLSGTLGAAVGLTAEFLRGSAPITLKNSKALIGTLPAGQATPAIPFGITVLDDAIPDNYNVYLSLKYRTLTSTSTDDDDLKAEWEEQTEFLTFQIIIKGKPVKEEPQLAFKISRLEAAKFAPGDAGYLQISFQNNQTIGKIDEAAIRLNLSQNYGAATGLVAHIDKGNAPVAIKTTDVLLGTLPAGQATPSVPVAIEIDENAVPGIYQAKVSVSYKTLKSTTVEDGDPRLEWVDGSASQDITIEIKDKILKFEVIEAKDSLPQGESNEIKVTFKNVGDETARNATAKLNAASPLSMTDNSAFLGDLKPGESATGTFGLKANRDAIVKGYTLDAFIQYTDTKGDNQVSETMKAPVTVIQAASLVSMARQQWTSIAAGAGAIVIIWIIVGVVNSRRKRG